MFANTHEAATQTDRARRLAALVEQLRIERKYSEIAARRYRLAMWVLA